MVIAEILQLALMASKFAREAFAGIPESELTPEQLQSLRAERDAVNAAWKNLAPPAGA